MLVSAAFYLVDGQHLAKREGALRHPPWPLGVVVGDVEHLQRDVRKDFGFMDVGHGSLGHGKCVASAKVEESNSVVH